ncbi:hypothetical protein PINS_up003761 [Pythium insidiosum]|nr:hypothetical protein PINS_up003761 [Pythium insidiosum]
MTAALLIHQVHMSARRLEELLQTELHVFEAESRPGSRLLRAASAIVLPPHVQDVVAFVNINSAPLHLRSLSASRDAREATVDAAGVSAVHAGTRDTLSEIRRSYGIPDDLVGTNANNSQALPSFYHESWDPADLNRFYKQFLPQDAMPTIIAKGDRVNEEHRASIEASLDVQYLTGVARNVTTYVWTMAGHNPFSTEDEPFVAFAEDVLAQATPPLVVSISYSDDEEHIFQASAGYARSFDSLLIKMGLRGITVLIASGDDGVAGLRPEFARLPSSEACNQHGPQWPSSSPYITSVGATMRLSDLDFSKSFFRTNEEVVCSGEMGGMITTGGGFSNVYSVPSYQRRAVNRYLARRNRLPKADGFFNASGRAYPDISALGASFNVFMHGRETSVSGTSASTPVVAAMVTLWNDVRLNGGKSPLGFINPLLYFLAENEPSAFNDVVIGNNGAAKGNGHVCENAFAATPGWDAASGVGTPNFAFISDFIRNMEDKFNVSGGARSAPSEPVLCSSVQGNVSTAAEGENHIDPQTSSDSVRTILIVAVALGAVVGVALLTYRLVKHWRNQYVNLSSDPSPSERRPESAKSPSSTSHDADGESGDVELSDISLHD